MRFISKRATTHEKNRKHMTIAEIEKLTAGSTINEIVGKAVKVYEPKGKGPWNLVLEDASGSIRVSVWTTDSLKDLYGKKVTVRGRGPKDLTVKYSDFSKKNEVSASKNCGIFDDSELGGASSSSAVQSSSGKTVADARKAIFQASQLMVECIRASGWIRDQVKDLSQEQLQAICSALFISADRAGFAKAFPAGASVEEPKAKKEDEDDLGW